VNSVGGTNELEEGRTITLRGPEGGGRSTRYVSLALFIVMALDWERTHDSVRWLEILNRRIEPVSNL
jgi:hypothetical protein